MSDSEPRRFLLAVDGSVHADRAAEYLVHNAPALAVGEVIVLNVQPLGEYETYTAQGEELVRTVTELSMQATAVARRLVGAANLPYRLMTELGDPAHVIVLVAETERVHEIVIGRHGATKMASLVLGSVAYKVIHESALPVTVVGPPPDAARPPPSGPSVAHRVLLPFDGSEQAARAIDYVRGLGQAFVPLEVELFHAPSPIPSVSFPSREMIDAYYREQGEAVLGAAEDALRSAEIKFNVHLAPGHPAGKIVEAAEREDCCRIVMGTRGVGAVANLFLGSVAYRVVHLSPIPVTLVK